MPHSRPPVLLPLDDCARDVVTATVGSVGQRRGSQRARRGRPPLRRPSIASWATSVPYLAAPTTLARSARAGTVAGVGPSSPATSVEPAGALRYE
jgi:hypothetical protein